MASRARSRRTCPTPLRFSRPLIRMTGCSSKGRPTPIADDGSNGNYQAAVTTHLGWLTNSAIKAKFLANPNPSAIAGWSQDQAIHSTACRCPSRNNTGRSSLSGSSGLASSSGPTTFRGCPAPGTRRRNPGWRPPEAGLPDSEPLRPTDDAPPATAVVESDSRPLIRRPRRRRPRATPGIRPTSREPIELRHDLHPRLHPRRERQRRERHDDQELE